MEHLRGIIFQYSPEKRAHRHMEDPGELSAKDDVSPPSLLAVDKFLLVSKMFQMKQCSLITLTYRVTPNYTKDWRSLHLRSFARRKSLNVKPNELRSLRSN